MTGKMGTGGTGQLITAVVTPSGNGITLPPLDIYQGAGPYVRWY